MEPLEDAWQIHFAMGPITITRQSVSLPVKVAAQVRAMAKTRRLSATRMLVELIENGIETEKRKQQEFFELAERFCDGRPIGSNGLRRLMTRIER
jgi:hypothetical protein